MKATRARDGFARLAAVLVLVRVERASELIVMSSVMPTRWRCALREMDFDQLPEILSSISYVNGE